MKKQKVIKFIDPQDEINLENIDVPDTSFWIEGVAVVFTPKSEEVVFPALSKPLKKIKKN